MAPDVINLHPPLVIGEPDLDVLAEVLDLALHTTADENTAAAEKGNR
jgi:4-aminobutyrate aminotransferase/(S)-3-amino-2-methylpropionate transaminase